MLGPTWIRLAIAVIISTPLLIAARTALLTGKVTLRGGRIFYLRRREPVRYWLSVGTAVVFAVGILAASVWQH